MMYCILSKKELQHIVIVLYIAPICCKLCHSTQSPLPSPEYYSSSSSKVYNLAPLTILSLSPSLPFALPANQIFPLPAPISKSDASSIHLTATIPNKYLYPFPVLFKFLLLIFRQKLEHILTIQFSYRRILVNPKQLILKPFVP